MSHKLKNIPLYLLLMSTFGLAAFGKVAAFEIPEWFIKQFEGSLLDMFPGSLAVSFILITVLEVLAFILLLVSFIRKEFLPDHEKKILPLALIVSELTFVALCFGQRLTHKNDSAFQLFAYAVLTYLAGHLVLKVRPRHE